MFGERSRRDDSRVGLGPSGLAWWASPHSECGFPGDCSPMRRQKEAERAGPTHVGFSVCPCAVALALSHELSLPWRHVRWAPGLSRPPQLPSPPSTTKGHPAPASCAAPCRPPSSPLSPGPACGDEPRHLHFGHLRLPASSKPLPSLKRGYAKEHSLHSKTSDRDAP